MRLLIYFSDGEVQKCGMKKSRQHDSQLSHDCAEENIIYVFDREALTVYSLNDRIGPSPVACGSRDWLISFLLIRQ